MAVREMFAAHGPGWVVEHDEDCGCSGDADGRCQFIAHVWAPRADRKGWKASWQSSDGAAESSARGATLDDALRAFDAVDEADELLIVNLTRAARLHALRETQLVVGRQYLHHRNGRGIRVVQLVEIDGDDCLVEGVHAGPLKGHQYRVPAADLTRQTAGAF